MTLGHLEREADLQRFIDSTLGSVTAKVNLLAATNLVGAGTPNGVVAAPVGTTFHRTDGGTASTLYIKEGGGSGSSGWVPAGTGGGGAYTDEQAQDAVGAALANTTTIVFTYNDAANTISAVIPAGTIDDSLVAGSGITTRTKLPAALAYEDEVNTFTVQEKFTGDGGASVSTGGAVNITTTGNTGAGLVIYSNRGADAAGRALAIFQDNPLNPQSALRVTNDGTGISAQLVGTHTSGNEVLDLLSSSTTTTVLGVQGDVKGQSLVKLTHNHPTGAAANDDSGAAVLRLNWQDDAANGTAVQGIFMATEPGGPATTGDLVKIWNGPSSGGTSTTKLWLDANGQLKLNQTGTTGGLQLGADVLLYRSAANQLNLDTGDSFVGTIGNLTQITTRVHADLQSLSADDHSIYALLAGRAGGQTLIGGTGGTDALTLRGGGSGGIACDLTVAENRSVNLTGFTSSSAWAAAQTFIFETLPANIGQSGGFRALVVGGSPTLASNTTGIPFLVFNFNATPVYDNLGLTTNMSNKTTTVYRDTPTYSVTGAGTGTIKSFIHRTVFSSPTFGTTLAGSTITDVEAVYFQPKFNSANWGPVAPNGDVFAVRADPPGGTGGTIVRYGGLYVADPTTFAGTITTPLSVYSLGTTVQMQHAGPARFGAVGAPTASTAVDVQGRIDITGDLRHQGSNVGFFNTAPAAKPTVTGSRGANAALASLLTALAGLGLLTDSST